MTSITENLSTKNYLQDTLNRTQAHCIHVAGSPLGTINIEGYLKGQILHKHTMIRPTCSIIYD